MKSLTEVVSQGFISSNPTLCKITGFVFYSTSLAGFLWTFVIANKLFKSIRDIPNSESDYWVIVAVVYFSSFGIGAVPFMMDEYGENYPSCDLKYNETAYILRFCIYYIPALFVIAYIGVVYTYIIKYARNNGDYTTKDSLRFRLFPIIMVICVLPALVARLFEFFWMDIYYLDVFCACLMFLQGLLDALAYVFTPPVIQFLKSRCKKRSDIKSVSSEMYMLDT